MNMTVKIATLQALLLHSAIKDARYYLNGILYDGTNGNLVSTDGHRILVVNSRFQGGNSFIIPIELVSQARKAYEKIDELELSYNAESSVVTLGGLTAKAIDGKYPEYKAVIGNPDECTEQTPAVFNPQYLLDANHAANLLSGLPKKAITRRVFYTKPVRCNDSDNKPSYAECVAILGAQSATHFGKNFTITIMPQRG